MTKKNENKNVEVSANVKENKNEAKVAKSRLNFHDVAMHGSYFKFSFDFPNGSYVCLYKQDLKGIASESFTIDGKLHKVGVKSAQAIANFTDDEVEEILSRRLKTLRKIRGDESNVEKISFEIDELKAKIENLMVKVTKFEKEMAAKVLELDEAKKEASEGKIDTKALIEASRIEKIEKLKKELENLNA